MNRLVEIFKSYVIANSPTQDQFELAENRFKICEGCEHRGSYFGTEANRNIEKCNQCGCPLSKKVFSPVFNACPLNKWKDVDSESNIFPNTKNKLL